jgi:hypothetical protein
VTHAAGRLIAVVHAPVIAVHAAHAGRTAARRTAPQFECAIRGEGFSQKARYERHLAASHLPPADSAATVEHAWQASTSRRRSQTS